jgi:hypothetical protein
MRHLLDSYDEEWKADGDRTPASNTEVKMSEINEKWSKGKTGGCVVSDTPNHHTRDDHVDYYGGHLIAESIPKQEYVNLISAAPDLLEALEGMLKELHDGVTPLLHRGKPGAFDVCTMRIAAARAAIAKAKGEL